MTNGVVKVEQAVSLAPETVEALILNGDLSRLAPAQKVEYVKYRCQSLGLDPAAKPFELLTLNGKQVLYATAACTQQLCESRKLSVSLVGTEMVNDVVVVTARVTDKERSTENVGAVAIGALKGDALANAVMKCRTKAIRRTVLAHCGLGMLDETELETIPNAKPEQTVAPAPIPPAVGEADAKSGVSAVSDSPGEFITPFGTVAKGKMIQDLSEEQIKKGIAYARSRNIWGEWVVNAEAFLTQIQEHGSELTFPK